MRDSNYYNPVKIISGLNASVKLKDFIPAGRCLVITDPVFTGNGTAAKIAEQAGSGDTVIFDGVKPNPELEDIDNAVSSFRGQKFSSVIALGGGSVMDFAKAVAVFLTDHDGRSLDLCLRKETCKLPGEKLFLAAVPTTSGTGSEVTPFATVWDSVTQKKFSLAGDMVFPSLAILDPCLTVGLPAEVSLYTGLDAISHSLESLWNKNRSAVSESFSVQSLRLALKSLPDVVVHPDNIEARAAMQWSGTLGGMAISQTRTAIAHSVSYPLTLKYGVPHGLACSFTLCGLIDFYVNSNEHDISVASLLGDVRNLLMQYNLPEKIAGYATREEIMGLIGEMYNPARADNYIIRVDEMFIPDLLNKSLQQE